MDSFDDGRTWFLVGEDITRFSTTPNDGAGGPREQLRLAVNRPNFDDPAAGDGSWAVTVECFEPSGGSTGGPNPELCREVRSELARLRTENAHDVCQTLGHASQALENRQRETETAFEVAGGLAIAVTLVAVAPLVPAAIAEHGAQRAAIEVVKEILKRALELVNPVVGAISAVVTAAAAGASARSATSAARAAAFPATANVFMAVVIAALIIAMVAAFVVAIAMLLSLLTLGAERDNELSRWNSVVAAVQSLAAFGRQVCEPPSDEVLPTCRHAEARG